MNRIRSDLRFIIVFEMFVEPSFLSGRGKASKNCSIFGLSFDSTKRVPSEVCLENDASHLERKVLEGYARFCDVLELVHEMFHNPYVIHVWYSYQDLP